MQLFKLTFDLGISKLVALVFQTDEAAAIQHVQRKLAIDKRPIAVVPVSQELGIVYIDQSAQPRYDD